MLKQSTQRIIIAASAVIVLGLGALLLYKMTADTQQTQEYLEGVAVQQTTGTESDNPFIATASSTDGNSPVATDEAGEAIDTAQETTAETLKPLTTSKPTTPTETQPADTTIGRPDYDALETLPPAEPDETYPATEMPKTTAQTKAPEIGSDGFPKNPVDNQTYTDDQGRKWVYFSDFGDWLEAGPAISYELPLYTGEDAKEVILH